MCALRVLYILLVLLFYQATSIATAVAAFDHENFIYPQNLTSSLTNATSNQNALEWPLSPLHLLKFTSYSPATPERNYFAALLSLQTSIFSNYTASHSSPTLDDEVIDHAAYGVIIEIDNFDRLLDYGLLSEVVGGVGAFLRRWKFCEANWMLVVKEKEEQRVGKMISVGSIKKGDAPWVDSAVA